MLKDLFESQQAQSILKIVLRNSQTVILEYPSYEIIAHSEDLSPEDKQTYKRPKDIKHYVSQYAERMGNDMLEFRLNGTTSIWIMLFKRSSFDTLELVQVTDSPIFHNDKLVGTCMTFKNISLNDIYLINKIINKETNDKKESIIFNKTLSKMEKEVLFFAALNKSNKQIAILSKKLGIRSTNHDTIKTLISQRIYKKMDVETLDDAIINAIKLKQLDKIPESVLASKFKDYYLIETQESNAIIIQS